MPNKHTRADASVASQVRLELGAEWTSAASQIGTAAAQRCASAVALPAVSNTPWKLACDGDELSATVGPVPLNVGMIRAALHSMRQLHASTGLDAADDRRTGRWSLRLLPPRPVSHRACELMRQLLGGPLTDLVGAEALDSFDVSVESGRPVLLFGAPMLSVVAEQMLLLLAYGGAAVALEAPDGCLPPGGLNELLTDTMASLAGAQPRQTLDLLGGATSRTSPSAAAIMLAPGHVDVCTAQFGVMQIVEPRSYARPADEADQPGSGCSDSLGLIDSTVSDDEDALWLLFRLDHDDASHDQSSGQVSLSAWFMPGRESSLPHPVPVPSLTEVAVPALRVGEALRPRPRLQETVFEHGAPHAFVARIEPRRDLLPTPGEHGWGWDDADAALRMVTPDGRDPFTFAHLFKQRLRIELTVTAGPKSMARRATEVDVFDVDRFGSLYTRLITRLVRMDTQAQVGRQQQSRVFEAYHPWYPVLAIGLHKARLYLAAVREDVCWQRHNLADPSWLMRVGLYLEFLTCLGIIEAVKDDYPDLLSDDERRCFAESPAFKEMRDRVDPGAWRSVWALRGIVFAHNPLTSAGPVDFRNLVRKEAAIQAFLEAHHADLKHAIELAGPNLSTSQQTWHRVFRDAERAVLDTGQEVFPEFRHLRATYQEFVLWHQHGRFSAAPMGLLPPSLMAAFGDRDGVYPSASRRYRASMNEIATWAMKRELMSYEGVECIPASASLIEARLAGDDERFTALQALDGHGAPLDAIRRQLVTVPTENVEAAVSLLRAIEIFAPLSVSELWRLAQGVEHRQYHAGRNVVRQGDSASGLYIIERGSVEVLARQPDGTDLVVDRMAVGDLFGEFSLLTGQPVSATVRAVDDVEVTVLPQSALKPIIQARPELIVELSVVLAERRGNRHAQSEQYLFGSSGPANTGTVNRLVRRIRDVLLT